MPVLVTPVARLLYDFGSLLDTHARYTLAMQQLAAREHVALIDLNDRSMRWIRALGEQDRQRQRAMGALRQRKMEDANLEWIRQVRDRAYVEIRLEDQ